VLWRLTWYVTWCTRRLATLGGTTVEARALLRHARRLAALGGVAVGVRALLRCVSWRAWRLAALSGVEGELLRRWWSGAGVGAAGGDF